MLAYLRSHGPLVVDIEQTSTNDYWSGYGFGGFEKDLLQALAAGFRCPLFTLRSQTEIYPVQNWSLEMSLGAFLQTPAPVLDKISGPMGAQFLSSTGLGFGTVIESTQFPPAPALDKYRPPIRYEFGRKAKIHLRTAKVASEGKMQPRYGIVLSIPIRKNRFSLL